MSESAERSLSKMEGQIERLLERIEGMKEGMDGMRAAVEKAVNNHGALSLEQARMDERLRTIEREVGAMKRDVVAADKAHDERLTAVERRMWTWGGMITAGVGVVTVVIELAFKH